MSRLFKLCYLCDGFVTTYMVKAHSYLFLMIFIQLWVVALNAQNESYQITIPVASNTIQLDGILDDEEWQSASQADDFWLQDPIDGIKASLETIVRIQADEKNLYVAAICMDDNGMIAQTLKRDQFSGSDAFGVFIDPVAEQTNGNGFIVTAHNAQTEMSLSPDEEDESWDNRWYSATERYVDRWVVEIAIPLKTLRYKSDNDRWHINFARAEPGRNEVHVWAPVPRQFAPADLGYYGTAIWDIQPKKSKNNISAIPYIRASLDQSSVGEKTTTTNTDVGMDGKIAITPSLNLDLTYNPDFSQVEVDVQVTNLTRFNIFFPERRQFFLENADIFSDYGQFANAPFYSRRIGLTQDGRPLDIRYGLRLSGNINAKTRVGLMNMHTAGTGANNTSQNYTAAAFQRRIWKRSSIKGIFLNRQSFEEGEFSGTDYGRNLGGEFNYSTADGKWQGQAAYIKSFKEGVSGSDAHTYGRFDYNGELFRTFLFVQHVGTNYFADMGFNARLLNYDPINDEIVRIGYTQVGNMLNYYIYPEDSKSINFHWSGLENFVVINDLGYGLNDWYTRLRHFIFFKNTSQLRFRLNHQYVDLIFPFTITETPLPEGDYNFAEFNIQFNTDTRKKFLTEWFIVYGQFYNGTKLTYRGSVTHRIQPWGLFTIGIERNEIRLPEPFGSRNITLATGRAEVNFSTNLFWTTFVQYNTQADNFNINSRLQWRFAPMSDLFFVYTDNYTIEDLFGPKDRSVVLKLNYWFTL